MAKPNRTPSRSRITVGCWMPPPGGTPRRSALPKSSAATIPRDLGIWQTLFVLRLEGRSGHHRVSLDRIAVLVRLREHWSLRRGIRRAPGDCAGADPSAKIRAVAQRVQLDAE